MNKVYCYNEYPYFASAYYPDVEEFIKNIPYLRGDGIIYGLCSLFKNGFYL